MRIGSTIAHKKIWKISSSTRFLVLANDLKGLCYGEKEHYTIEDGG